MANIKSNHAEKNLVIMVIVTLVIVALGYAIDTLHIDEKLFPNLKKVAPGAALLSQIGNIFKTVAFSTSSQNQTSPSATRNNTNTSGSYSGKPISKNTVTQNQTADTTGRSQYYGMVRIERGNAGSQETNPNEEYIVLRASSKNVEPIVITGWTLKNAGDQKYYNDGGSQVRGTSSYVTIPTGTDLFSDTELNTLYPISLYPNDYAIVVSGRMPISYPINVDLSFRVNKCSGYIESLDNYNFSPTLRSYCPTYRDIPDTDLLDDTCGNFVRNIGQCLTPSIQHDKYGNELIGGRIIPISCISYVEKNYSYGGCVKEFSNDDDFLTHEWRIFLHSFIMWSRMNETITLLDSEGKIVSTLSY